MPVLTTPDPAAEIACTLPVLEMGGRLVSLQKLIGGSLRGAARNDRTLRIVIDRDGRSSVYADTVAWATAEKACCAFLGFAVEEAEDRVTLEIGAPAGAEATLDGIEVLVRAAARPEVST
jgi:hypothetical protein